MQDFPLAEGLPKPIGLKVKTIATWIVKIQDNCDDAGTFAFGYNAMDVIVSKCKMSGL